MVSSGDPGRDRQLSPRNGRPRLDLTGATIAIIEDDPDSLDMLEQMVSAFGATVLTARDGREGMRVLSEAPTPDLVMCDLMMPDVNGFDFMKWICREPRLCRVPVLAVTALGTMPDVMATWEAGFTSHILKPLDWEMVEAQLRRIFWAHWAAQQSSPERAASDTTGS